MTLPDERLNSIKRTRDFLRSLLDPKQTPKIPREIRSKAGSCLRHYPNNLDLEEDRIVEAFHSEPWKEEKGE